MDPKEGHLKLHFFQLLFSYFFQKPIRRSGNWPYDWILFPTLKPFKCSKIFRFFAIIIENRIFYAVIDSFFDYQLISHVIGSKSFSLHTFKKIKEKMTKTRSTKRISRGRGHHLKKKVKGNGHPSPIKCWILIGWNKLNSNNVVAF